MRTHLFMRVNRLKASWSRSLLAMASSFLMTVAMANTPFEPAQTPLAYVKPPKPNVIVFMDNSGAMASNSRSEGVVWMKDEQHWRNFENSLRSNPSILKNTPYEKTNYMNVRPYGLAQILLAQMVNDYSQNMYFGFSHFLARSPHNSAASYYVGQKQNNTVLKYSGQDQDVKSNRKVYNQDYDTHDAFLYIPLTDLSDEAQKEAVVDRIYNNVPRVEDQKFNAIYHRENKRYQPFHTFAFTTYELAKYLRGYGTYKKGSPIPLPQLKGGKWVPDINIHGSNFEYWTKPEWEVREYPQRYRCQENHIIIVGLSYRHMGDGYYGVVPHDDILSDGYCNWCMGKSNFSKTFKRILAEDPNNFGGGYDIISRSFDMNRLAKQLKAVDMRYEKGHLESARPEFDDAGKAWTDEGSKQMNITLHAIQLGKWDLKNPSLKNTGIDLVKMADVSGGVGQTVIDHIQFSNAMNDIFGSIIPEKKYDTKINDGPYITLNSIAYQSAYDANRWAGKVKAIQVVNPNKEEPLKPGELIQYKELWSTDKTFRIQKESNYRYNPFKALQSNHGPVSELPLNQATHISNNMKNWIMYGRSDNNFPLRNRATLMDDIINSNMLYFRPDIFYGNMNQYPRALRDSLLRQGLDKRTARNNQNRLIIGSNDGLINIIRAEKDSIRPQGGSNSPVAKGEREKAFLVDTIAQQNELNNVLNISYNHKFSMDGKNHLFDYLYAPADLYDASADKIKLYGLSLSMQGAGGRGFVVNSITPKGDIEGLLYIDTDTPGFEDLGYTLTDPDFTATTSRLSDGSAYRTASIVLGNGYGSQSGRSVVYILTIDPESSTSPIADLQRIYLNKASSEFSGGAGSPAILTSQADVDGKQYSVIDAIYVGDLKGGLYRITFPDRDVTTYHYGKPNVVKIFQDPNNHPIHAQPTVAKDRREHTWVFFGTGLAARTSDKYTQDTFHYYGLRDDVENNDDRIYSSELLVQKMTRKIASKVGSSFSGISNEYTVQFENNMPGSLLSDQYRGWVLPLKAADEISRGERIISPSFYFTKSPGVIGIRTWGIIPATDALEADDPCLDDRNISKLLFLDMWTGNQAKNSDGDLVTGYSSEDGLYGEAQGQDVIIGNPSGGRGDMSSPQPEGAPDFGVPICESGVTANTPGNQEVCLEHFSSDDTLSEGRLYLRNI